MPTASDRRPDTDSPAAPISALLGDLGSSDIEAMVFTVLTEAAESARDDLKQIMAEVKAINATKRHLRELLAPVARDVVAASVAGLERGGDPFAADGLGGNDAYHRVCIPVPDADSSTGVQIAEVDLIGHDPVTYDDLCGVKDEIKNRLDSMSELGEMVSLRLQMAMDRRSKMMSTLSNILKKISDTDSTIVQNLK
jgi:hypothetical protein